MTDRITDPAALAVLPDGTIVASTDDCAWPARYAGLRWRKGPHTMAALDPDPITGERGAAPLALFADPLPVQIIGFDPTPPANLFGD